MNIRLLIVVALATAACSSGTRTVVIHAAPRTPPPAEVSPPRPPAAVPVLPTTPREPLELVVGRPVGRHLHLQTNRPAYVAVFEITTDAGVEIVHPASARQQRRISGADRAPLWWNPQDAAPGQARSPSGARVVRYIYAIASEQPLRLTDAAFVQGGLVRVAGLDARSVRDPYLVMRALARRFVPPIRDEQWAEDVYRLGTRTVDAGRVARAFCANGVVVEVPEEIADRLWCPANPGALASSGGTPSRPDSIKSNNGRHLAVRARGEPAGRAPGRVTEDRVPDRGDGDAKANDDVSGNGRGSAGGNAGGRAGGPPADRGSGNAPGMGRGGAVGQTTRTPVDASSIQTKVETGQEAKPDPKTEPKPEIKGDGKAESGPDPKPDVKPQPKAEGKSDAKAEIAADLKPDGKPQPKTEPKTDAKAEIAADLKPDGKPQPKAEAKADGKADDKQDAKPGAKADAKGKPTGPTTPPPPDSAGRARGKPPVRPPGI